MRTKSSGVRPPVLDDDGSATDSQPDFLPQSRAFAAVEPVSPSSTEKVGRMILTTIPLESFAQHTAKENH